MKTSADPIPPSEGGVGPVSDRGMTPLRFWAILDRMTRLRLVILRAPGGGFLDEGGHRVAVPCNGHL